VVIFVLSRSHVLSRNKELVSASACSAVGMCRCADECRSFAEPLAEATVVRALMATLWLRQNNLGQNNFFGEWECVVIFVFSRSHVLSRNKELVSASASECPSVQHEKTGRTVEFVNYKVISSS
jgi:hypothetical protein